MRVIALDLYKVEWARGRTDSVHQASAFLSNRIRITAKQVNRDSGG